MTPSSDPSHDIMGSRDTTPDDGLEEPAKEPEGPVNEELVVRFGRYLQELKRKRQLADFQERTLCQECGYVPFDPAVANCFHVFCKKCLMQLARKASAAGEDEVPCPKCEDIMMEVQSCIGLEELRLLNPLEAGHQLNRTNDRKTEEGYIDLEGEDTDQPVASELTVAQKKSLVKWINELMKLSCDDFFRMNLKTMRSKLRDGLYPSIEALKADFDRMEHNSITEYGFHQKNTKDAQNLKAAFERYMTDYPGPSEELAPRKKAKTTGSKTPPDQMPARVGTSSRPRAAKSVMQGRKYARDHW